jgi:hypothetical protein
MKNDPAKKRKRLVDLLVEVHKGRHEAWAANPMIDVHPESCAPPDRDQITRDVAQLPIFKVEELIEFHSPGDSGLRRYVW